ncbi:MAG: hypothetical protein NDJ89_02930 [Oligoflexia bacterium]|nr:hypothetical protein [Oligoflexia bacterium]
MTQGENWVFDHTYSRMHLQFEGAWWEQWHHRFAPFADPLFAPSRPLFLIDGLTKLQGSGTPVLARDGLLPLTWFFRNVIPKDFPPDLLIPENFFHLVPPSWRGKARSFRLERRGELAFLPDEPPERIILIGVFSQFFMGSPNKRYFERQLARLQTKWGREAMRKIRWLLWLPIHDPRSISARTDRAAELFYKTLEGFGPSIEFSSWGDLSMQQDLREWAFIELNTRLVIGESYCRHHLLSRGARELALDNGLARVPRKLEARVEPLSPYHELVIDLDPVFAASAAIPTQELEEEEKILGTDSDLLGKLKDQMAQTWKTGLR